MRAFLSMVAEEGGAGCGSPSNLPLNARALMAKASLAVIGALGGTQGTRLVSATGAALTQTSRFPTAGVDVTVLRVERSFPQIVRRSVARFPPTFQIAGSACGARGILRALLFASLAARDAGRQTGKK